MADTRIKVVLDLDSDISKAKSSINQLNRAFSNIGGSKGNALTSTLEQIEKEFTKLQNISGSAMNKVGDFSKVENSTIKIDSAIKKLSKELVNMGTLSADQAQKMFPPTILAKINKVNSAIKTYNTEIKKSENNAIKQATKEFENQQKKVKELSNELQKYEQLKSSKKLVSQEDYNQAKSTLTVSRTAATKAQNKVASLQMQRQAAIDEYNSKTGKNTGAYSKGAKDLQVQIKAAQEEAKKLADNAKQAEEYFKTLEVKETLTSKIENTKKALEEATQKSQDLQNNLNNVKADSVAKAMDEARKKLEGLTEVDLSKVTNIEQLNQLFEKFNQEGIESFKKGVLEATGSIQQLDSANKGMARSAEENKDQVEKENRALSNVEGLKSRIQYFFSLTNTVQLARRAVRQAVETIKELDAAMTETAVVTDFNVGDMWEQLPRYTETANNLGTTTLGAYQTMTLFYQQGLETNEVFEIGTETMKMARIAGLEYSDATNLMTAALRGFNMELNETSAQRVNDVYSELAAITAADTEEIATAMTKTASIAANANMEFETTAALLAQIIETTREPAETAGTAMKTIIARFTEMKKATSDIVSVDGEEVSVNKVEAALKSAGVALRDVNGEFRDLDDVFLELSSKWNSLDMMTQRYVATMAAGSRQQSRFIAMMSDYDRTLELVDAAYDSSGASQKQFEKTQDSLESKINELTNAWNEFLMGITNSSVIKGAVDLLTGILNVINKITGAFGEGVGGVLKFGVALATLKGGEVASRVLAQKAIAFTEQAKKSPGDKSNTKFFYGGSPKEKVTTGLNNFTERLNNFNEGKGFKLNVDLDTEEAQAELTALEGKAVETGATTAAAMEAPQAELNNTTIDAAAAGEAVENIDDGALQGAQQIKIAQDQVQSELDQTIAKAEAAKAKLREANPDVDPEDFIRQYGKVDVDGNFQMPSGGKTEKTFANTTLRRQEAKGLLVDVKAGMDAKEIKQAAGTMGDVADKVDDVGDALQTTTPKAKGLGGALKGAGKALAGFVTSHPILLAIAGTLAAIGVAAYAVYNNSNFKKVKNEAEMAASAQEDYKRALENTKKELSAMDSILSELDSRNDTFDNLIVGSNEWYVAIQKSNEALLEQIQLLETLGYSIDYSYDENGLIQLDDQQQLKEAQKELAQRQIELQKGQSAANYGNEVASLKQQFIKDNAKQEKEAFGETFKKGMAATAATMAATEAVGLTASGVMASNGVGALGSGIVAAATQTVAAVEGITGTVISTVKGLKDSTDAVEEISKEGSYADLTQEQKDQIDLEARKQAASTFSLYVEDGMEKKAGQKIIANAQDAYEQFYSDEALSKQLDEKYIVNSTGNPELELKDRDIKASDLDTVIKDLGYEDWNEAATALGMKWDKDVGGVAGLYTTDEKGDKKYFDVTNHGQVDTTKEWEELLSDPSGKNIDAGFLALKLAKSKNGKNIAKTISDVIGGSVEEILYGTDDWVQKDTSNIADPLKKAKQEAINQANARKKEIRTSLLDTTVFDKNGEKSSFFSEKDEYLNNLASNIQKLEVDINETTAAGFQAFMSAKKAQLTDITSSEFDSLQQEYYNIFKDINLDDPTVALEVLNQKIEQGNEKAQELKENLTAKGQPLDISNQFKDLLTSGVLEEISEEIAKISDSAGNIDVSATRELVDSNTELKNIMDEFQVSGYAMGKILTDIQKGELTLTDINNGLVESYKLLYSAVGQAEDVLYDLSKADLGEDYTDIGKIYEERYETIKDLYERGAYGSANFAGNIKSLIGEEEWNSILAEADYNNKAAYEEVLKRYKLDQVNGNLYGSFSALISANKNDIFTNKNGMIEYDFSGFETYDEILDHMVASFGISRDYAKAMLADMATYSETLQNDLNNLNAATNANNVYNSMWFDTSKPTDETDLDGKEIYTAYTELTDAQLADTFRQTQEWADAIEQAKRETEDWDTKDLQEQTKLTAKAFKEAQKIVNTVEVGEGENKKQYQIEKIDSQGNKYYRDEKGDLQVQRTDANIRRYRGMTDNYKFQTDQEYAEALSKDQKVINAAVELNDEEFQAWLADYTGDENTYQIMLDAGFTPESLTGVEQMKNEMIAKIQSVADVLANMSISIPIVFPKNLIEAITQKEQLEDTTAWITIGGKDSSGKGAYTTYTGEGGQDAIDTAIANYNKFTALKNQKPGTGYDKGDDPRDTDSGGGGSDNDNDFKPKNYAEENANKQLEALDRVRETNDREAELIGKLPEEIQFPLKMANLGEDMFYEYQEIQINKNKQAALQSQLKAEQDQAKYYGEYYYYDEFTDAYMYDVEKMESDDLDDEKRQEIEEEISNLQEINDKLNAVEDELDGGKIQKIFRGLAKASTDTSKALKGTSKASDMLEEEFGNLADKFGLGDQLDKFGKSLDSAIDESKFLKKEFKGLGIASEDMLSKIDSLPFGDATKSLIKNTLGTNENGTIGSFLGDSFGAAGEMFDGLADVLNFDMMSMGLDAFNNMKDMASKIIQQVVSVIQTVVNWWTNREDWLYNLLSAIEQEVHNFNRQEQVEERFRLYSDEGLNDLVSAWEAMRASLEKQIDLNEQLIKSRQAELQFLNLTNLPFSPAFYYDYKEERVIENPWVYDIYILLLDLGSMIPEIGGVFSSIKQLMEDNKKRMEDAVDEIESAREQILELEKQQLELRTKYMEDEEELEQLVMDAIIEKQQEEIDELTAMNDAISEGNQKLIDALNDNLDKIREMRDNQDREEELAQKERRLAYLRQDTSGANRAQILDLQKELEDERRDYTDNLIDQKISELEKQNEDAAAQRQKQIDLLQEQLDYTEKYGLQWKEAQTLIKNGFDNEGRLRVGSELFDLLMSKEDFTSLGNGSTRQNRQIMDWNVTGIAAAAYREINHIWDKGFGNFEMSNDVHDQSRLHLWEDRDIEYRQLPSWLSFLQPAYNSIQDYGWRTKQNLGSFIETGYLSGSNSSSILGKTVVPLIQRIAANIEAMVNDYKSISDAETGGAQKIAGVITSSTDNLGLSLGERILSGFSKSISTLGDDIINGVKAATQSNSFKTVTSTQNYGDIVFNNHFNSEENGDSIIERMVDFFRRGNQGLSVV